MPSVDEILGPELPDAGTFLGERTLPDANAFLESSPAEGFLANTSVGRVLDSFQQGLKDGWGARPLGFTPATENELRSLGVFPKVRASLSEPLRTFNEAMLRPAAAGIDAIMRGFSAVVVSTAQGVGAIAKEAGMEPANANRLTRDTLMLADTLGILAGTTPSMRPRAARETPKTEPLVTGEKPAALPPEKPALAASDVLPTRREDLVDRAGNINLTKINAPEDVKDVIREAADGRMVEQIPQAQYKTAATKEDGEAISNSIRELMKTRVDADELRRIDRFYGGTSGAADTVESLAPVLNKAYVPAPERITVFRGTTADAILNENAPVSTSPWVEAPVGYSYPSGETKRVLVQIDVEPGVKLAVPDTGIFGGEILIGPGTTFKTIGESSMSVLAGHEVKILHVRAFPKGSIDFVEARRGVQTWAQMQELADALGMSPEVLRKRKIGEAFNSEQITAARDLLVQSAHDVKQARDAAKSGAPTDAIAFQEAIVRHMMIQEQISGITAEAGRALNAFKRMAPAEGEVKDLTGVIKKMMGDKMTPAEIARRLDGLETPQQVSQFLSDMRKPSFGDKVTEVWINGLLSGPVTHIKNVVGNTGTSLWQVPETAVAATIGKTREVIGLAGEDRVRYGEAGARLFGLVQASREGAIIAGKTFMSGEPVSGASKLENMRPKAVPGVAGSIIRTPGRALMAEDEFFKAVNYRAEVTALAWRQASGEGLRGVEHLYRVAELVARPPDSMVLKASEFATEQTFQKDLGKSGQAIMDFAGSTPLARFVVTFVRTPVNLVKYAGERSPFGVLMKEVRDNLTGVNGAVAQDTQMARMALGTAIGITFASLAAEGRITGGGPADPRERAVRYMEGWRPYSIRIGDTYYSYNWADPSGIHMGVAADMMEIWEAATEQEKPHLAKMFFASVMKNVTNKTWAQGPSRLAQAVTDPERYGDRYIQQLVASFVPSVVGGMTRADDPFLRDVQTMTEAIKARIPGQSETLRPRRDIWGEPLRRDENLGPDMLSPVATSRLNNDPVNQELIRLKIWPVPLDKDIRGVKLTRDQYDEYQRVSGRFTKMTLDGLVATPGWGDLPEFSRREIIAKTISKTRETASTLMMMRHPDIIQQAVDKKMKDISGVAKTP